LKSKSSLDHPKGRFFLRKHYIRDYLLGWGNLSAFNL